MRYWRWFIVGLWVACLGAFAIAANASPASLVPTPTPTGRIATAEELALAQMAWASSAHADTYDNGLGANTTCARCKSPTNWDPSALAAEAALNCGSCKRTPGAARPDLEGGVPVSETDWRNIACDVCHPRAGDSYLTTIAYWDQANQAYQPVASATELCAKCHEGRHGFEVIEEQAASPAHTGWECTACHGSHGASVTCEDCHDTTQGVGSAAHADHALVNCTACHDAGGLSLWQETNPASAHFGEFVPLRFAHTLTSWPSHNLQLQVTCQRCHHPQDKESAPLASNISCDVCHADGAVLFWCEYFVRNPNPNVTPVATPPPSEQSQSSP